MTDIILIVIILIAVCCASFYVYRAKKNGQACIGCPHSKQCSNKCSCGCLEKTE